MEAKESNCHTIGNLFGPFSLMSLQESRVEMLVKNVEQTGDLESC
jgi:hypothetical protein